MAVTSVTQRAFTADELVNCASNFSHEKSENRDLEIRLKGCFHKFSSQVEKFNFSIFYFQSQIYRSVCKLCTDPFGTVFDEVDKIKRAVRNIEILCVKTSPREHLPPLNYASNEENNELNQTLHEKSIQEVRKTLHSILSSKKFSDLSDSQVSLLFHWGIDHWDKIILNSILPRFRLSPDQIGRLVERAFYFNQFEEFASPVILHYYKSLGRSSKERIVKWFNEDDFNPFNRLQECGERLQKQLDIQELINPHSQEHLEPYMKQLWNHLSELEFGPQILNDFLQNINSGVVTIWAILELLDSVDEYLTHGVGAIQIRHQRPLARGEAEAGDDLGGILEEKEGAQVNGETPSPEISVIVDTLGDIDDSDDGEENELETYVIPDNPR